MTDLHFFQELKEQLRKEDFAVATVIETKGSVPRQVGARLAINSSGKLLGTIGGGAGESKVIAVAQSVLSLGKNQLVIVDLTGNISDLKEGICGGCMEVWIERWSGSRGIALCSQIWRELEQNRPVTVIHPLTSAGFPWLNSFSDLENCFIDRIEPPPTLCIVGAGHIGIQLAHIASIVGFAIVVQDDRVEWANPENFPRAKKIILEPMTSAINYLGTTYETYVTLVTRGFCQDVDALTTLLESEHNFTYIGMIGSQKRVKQVCQSLIEKGFSREKIAQIHAPIGIPIGAITPEEIAVSICAEIIAVRRKCNKSIVS